MVSKVCHSQLSSSTLARAAHMPPWAAPVWERVGYSLVITAVRARREASSAARRPAPPAPTITTSKVCCWVMGLLGFAGCGPESEAISAPGSVARYLHAPAGGLWSCLADCRGRCLSLAVWTEPRASSRRDHGHRDPGLPVRARPYSDPASCPRVALRSRQGRPQLGSGVGQDPPRPASNRPAGAGAMDAAGSAAGMEPGEGRSRPMVGRELQGGLLLRPGWTGQSVAELERLQERSPQGPPGRLPTVQEEGPLSGRLPLHHRRDQGAA